MNKTDSISFDLGEPKRVSVLIGHRSVTSLTDNELLYYFDRLHHPDVVAESWVKVLQDEVLRRGLRLRS